MIPKEWFLDDRVIDYHKSPGRGGVGDHDIAPYTTQSPRNVNAEDHNLGWCGEFVKCGMVVRWLGGTRIRRR